MTLWQVQGLHFFAGLRPFPHLASFKGKCYQKHLDLVLKSACDVYQSLCFDHFMKFNFAPLEYHGWLCMGWTLKPGLLHLCKEIEGVLKICCDFNKLCYKEYAVKKQISVSQTQKSGWAGTRVVFLKKFRYFFKICKIFSESWIPPGPSLCFFCQQ